jgi:hypothetical protein
MTKPNCSGIICNRKITATHTLFHIQRTPNSTHIDCIRGRPRFCIECVKSKFEEDRDLDEANQQYFGILTTAEAVKYADACATVEGEDKPAAKFRREGYAIVEMSNISIRMGLMGFVEQRIKTKLWSSSMTKLAHNFLEDKNDGKRNHDHRRWKQIYPDEKGNDRTTQKSQGIRENLEMLTPFIEKNIFPHEFYARIAYNTAQVIFNTRKQCKNSLLTTYNANLLIKGIECNERQNMHTDGFGFKVIAILVELCGERGYDFNFIPGTHNLLLKHNADAKLPTSEVKSVTFGKSHILLFAENLIHGGGTSSMTEDELNNGEWLRTNKNGELYEGWFGKSKREQPTDISFQLSFIYNPISDVSEPGNAQPNWYKNETKNADNESVQEFKEYVKSGGNDFSTELDEAFPTWLAMIRGKHVRPKSNRAKKVRVYK